MRSEAGYAPEHQPKVEYPLPQEVLTEYRGNFERVMNSDMSKSEKSVEISNLDTAARINLMALYKAIEAHEKDLH